MADTTYKTKTLGYEITLKGPSSVEEYDRIAGKVGACLEDAIDNEIYRGTLPDVQDKFGAELVKKFGERGINQKATDAAKARAKDDAARAKVKDVKETWTTYHNRVTAGMSDDARKELATLIQQAADACPVNPTPTSRAKGPAKAFVAKADSILTLDEAAIEGKVEKLLSVVPDFELERDEAGKPERNSLARMIEAYTDASI
jgi:hypothetical protein